MELHGTQRKKIYQALDTHTVFVSRTNELLVLVFSLDFPTIQQRISPDLSFSQKCQIFPGSSLSNVKICCFSWFYVIGNGISRGFLNVTLGCGKLKLIIKIILRLTDNENIN